MRTRKIWNQIISMILVLALLPVSALAQYGTDSTKDTRIINEPKFEVDCVYVDPQMELLGLKIDRLPEYDFSTLGSKTVNSFAEATEYLREQFVNREEAITVTINNYQCDSQEQFDGDIAALQDALLAHTGVPTQGDYIARHLTMYNIGGGLNEKQQLTLYWTVVYKTTTEQEEVVDARVDELIAQWDIEYDIHNSSDLEKVSVIYDYICENVVYDYDHLTMGSNYPLMFSAYAALIDGKAVCQGYSNLFYRLALELGVDTRIISGNGNGGPHSWNIAKLGSSYYYLDSTWDAGRNQYAYFLLGSENFLADHILDAEYEAEAFQKEYPISKSDYDFNAEQYTYGYYYITDEALSYTMTNSLAMFGVIGADGGTGPLWFAKDWKGTEAETELYLDNFVENNKNTLWLVTWCDGFVVGMEEVVDRIDATADYKAAMFVTGTDYEVTPTGVLKVNTNSGVFVFNINAGTIIIDEDGNVVTVADINGNDLYVVYNGATAAVAAIFVVPEKGATGIIASGTCGDQLEWVLTADGTLTISGTGEMYNYGWNLYDYNGAPWFVYREHIKTIVIGDGVTGIGDYAFDECMSLADVTIPDSVQRIGTFAFVMCSSLTKIEIPVSVTSIGDYAFCDCGSLTTVYYGGTEAQWNAITVDVGIDPMLNVTPIFLGKDEGNADDAELITQAKKAGLLKYLEVTDLSAELTRLEAVKLLVAMMELEPVSGATLPFADCDALTQEEKELVAALVEAGIISGVGPDAFDPYAKLTYAQMAAMICRALGEPVENGPSWVVQAVVALKRLGIITGDSVSVNDIAQVRGALEWLIKAKVIFDDNNGGEDGIIASGECGENLVWYLTADGTLTIAGSGEMWDFNTRNQPWYDCLEQITAVVIEEGVASVGGDAFFAFWKITSVTLPSSLTKIGNEAFSYCESLREIVIPAGVTYIGNRAFVCCAALPAITVDSKNDYYCSVDGVLFNKNMTELIIYPSGKAGAVYEVPDGVTSLRHCSFEVRGSELSEVIIPASVVDLNGAFQRGETLTTITVDSKNDCYCSVDGVLFSKDMRFLYCYPVGNPHTEYKIPSGVEMILEYAFDNCYRLQRVIIPDSVKVIGSGAFNWCRNLTKVVLPSSLTEIGWGVFSGCESLVKAFYLGTEKQWGEIWIDEQNENLLSVVVYEADENDIYAVEKIDEGTCGANLKWVMTDDGTLTISGTGAMDSYNWNDRPWFAYREKIVAVVIEEGVTTVTDRVFEDCHNMQSVTLPNSLQSVGAYAFGWCYVLETVVLPDGLVNIGKGAFLGCTGLRSITIPASVKSISMSAFEGCHALTTVYYGGGERSWQALAIGSNNQPLLDANVICLGTDPAVEIIAQGTCSEALAWTLDNYGLLTISGMGAMDNYTWGESPWYTYCEQIITVVVEDGVTSIGGNAFYMCEKIKTVTLPDSVTSIESYAFCGCSSLVKIVLPTNLTSIGDYAFDSCGSLSSIEIPAGVSYIGSQVFGYCWSMSEITVSMENKNYSSLDGVLFDKDCTELICYPCGLYNNLYKIPATVTKIADYAFFNVEGLYGIQIPDSVKTIGEGAFQYCNNLKTVEIPAGVSYIGSEAFGYCWSLSDITVSADNKNYCSVDGVLFSKDMTVLYTYPRQKPQTEYKIPSSVTEIGDGAFGNCRNLTSIIIPDGVTSIGFSAFSNCQNLVNLELPANLQIIGNFAFGNCSGLKIMEIPEGVAIIDRRAFAGCIGLECVTIPVSVSFLGQGTFQRCDSLTTVYYGGTEAQWNAITVDVGIDPMLNVTPIFLGEDEGNADDAELITQAKKAGLLKYLEVTDLSANLSRLDAVKLFVAMMGLKPVDGATLNFTDCDGLTQEEKELVAAAVKAGLILGNADDTFTPFGVLTKAQLATVIYRALGSPKTENSEGSFPVWYLQAIIALQDLGIITENDITSTATETMNVEGTLRWLIKAKAVMDEFVDAELIAQAKKAGLLKYLDVSDLSAELTRLDAVKLLVAMMGLEPVSGATLNFTDCEKLTQEEKELVAAAVNAGLVNGTGPDTFDPYAYLTKATLATVIYRALGSPKTENSEGSFPAWYLQAIIALQDLGIITEEDITTTAMEIVNVEATLNWLIKAKAIFEDNNGGGETGTQYEIHFYANGGKLIIGDKEYDSSKRMTNGEGKLGEKNVPAAPVRDGYTFAGWYTAAGERIDVTSETVFTENTSLYAHWLNSDGVDISNYALEFEISDNGLFVTVIPPVETENFFWVVFKNSQNTNQLSQYWCDYMVLLLPGDSCDVAEIYEFVDGETKLCGVVELSVPIRCESAEMQWPGTGDVGIAVTYNNETARYDFGLSGLEVGYHYVLYSQANGGIPNGMRFNCRPDGTMDFRSRNCESDLELRAAACELKNGEYVISLSASRAVVPGSYSVTLNANGGDLGENASVITTDKNGNVSVLPEPTRDGYVFEGWFTAAYRGVAVNDTTVFMSNMTIYAQWTEDKHEHTGDWKYDSDNHWRVCEECGEQFDYAEHDWKLVEEFPASCRDEGYEIYHCACGAEKTETYEKLECTYVTIPGQEPTCTEWGWYEYQECSVCGGVPSFKDIEPLGHDYDDGVVTKEPTITEVGVKTYTCKREGCGDHYTEEIPMLEAIARGTCGEDLVWGLDKEGILTISGTGAMYDFKSAGGLEPHSVIPMSETSLEVAPWSAYSSQIKQVVVKDGVTSIGDNAFADCEQLTEVKIPKTVTEIGDDVFTGCEALETVTYSGTEEQWEEIEIGAGKEVVEEKVVISAVLMGDVTGDGKINVGDAVKLLKAIASKTTDEFSDEMFKAADVTRDGKLNVGDAVKLLKAIASKTTDEL